MISLASLPVFYPKFGIYMDPSVGDAFLASIEAGDEFGPCAASSPVLNPSTESRRPSAASQPLALKGKNPPQLPR